MNVNPSSVHVTKHCVVHTFVIHMHRSDEAKAIKVAWQCTGQSRVTFPWKLIMHPGLPRPRRHHQLQAPGFRLPSSHPSSTLVLSWLVPSFHHPEITKQSSTMSEKAPLIPIAAPAEPCTRGQRCSKGRAMGRLLVTAAAAGLIYYGMPYGM
jgi:hypothetical protein